MFQSTSIREGSMNLVVKVGRLGVTRFNPHRSAKDR